MLGNVRSWHLFNTSLDLLSASSPLNSTYQSPIAQKIRSSWRIPLGDVQSPAYQELHFDEAIDIIYKHQHPQDCRKASYLLSEGYKTGFGSEVHVEGFGLAMAMELGRVYMPMRERFKDRAWQTPESLCEGDTSWFCYFETWTNCTYQHVDELLKNQPQIPGFLKVRVYKYTQADIDYYISTGRISEAAKQSRMNEKVTRILHTINFEFMHLIPHQLSGLLDKSRVPPSKRHYWWRAVSAAYLIQPNHRTQTLLKKLATPGLKKIHGKCVSMYVRRGDKCIEMELLDFETYGATAQLVWDMTYHRSTIDINANKSLKGKDQENRVIFFGTETPAVVEEALAWGQSNHWKTLYNPLQDEIFKFSGNEPNNCKRKPKIIPGDPNPKEVMNQSHQKISINGSMIAHKASTSIIPSAVNRPQKNVVHRNHHTDRRKLSSEHSDYEFLSIIINLADLMNCDSFVCTLMSNYCRLLDELRAVVAAKPSAIFADLSVETCTKPPCIGPDNIKSFDWR